MSIQINRKIIISLGVLASIIASYAALGSLVLPWYVKNSLTDYVATNLQRELVIDQIKFNPFNFNLDVNNIALKENDQTTIVSASNLFIDINVNELLDKTLIISKLRLNSPQLELIRDKTGSLNLDRLLQSFPNNEDSDNVEPVLNFVFVSTQITQGSILLIDNAQAEPIKSTIQDINLGFSSISTFKQDAGKYQVSLDLDEKTKVNLNGTLTLFPLSSAGQIKVDGLSAESIDSWSRDLFPVDILQGNVTVDGDYKLLTNTEGNILFNIDKADISIKDILITERQTQVSTSLKDLVLKDLSYASESLSVDVKNVLFSGLNIKAKDQTLLDVSSLSVADIGYNIEKIKLKLSTLELNGLELMLRNKTAPLYHLGQLKISDIAFDNQENQVAIDKIEINENSAVLEVDATGRFVPPEFNLESNVVVEQEPTNTEEPPRLSVKLDHFQINNTTLALLNLFDVEAQENLLSINEVELIKTEYDLTKNSLVMDVASLIDANINLAIDSEGVLNAQQLFSSNEGTAEGTQTNKENAFRVSLAKFLTKDLDIHLTDNTAKDGIQHYINDIGLEMDNLNNTGQTRSQLNLNANVNDSGKLSLAGWVETDTAKVHLDIALSNIDLAYLSPYVERDTNVSVKSGELTFEGTLSNTASETGFLIDQVEAELDNFLLNDQRNDARLISFNKLWVADFGISTSPLDVRVDKIKLSQPYINVHIDEQQILNLVGAFSNKEYVSDNTDGQESSSDSASSFNLKRIEVEQGNMDFSDLSMTPKFSVTIDELGGVVTGLNSVPERYTSLDLNGRVNEFGSIAITGELQPFDYRKQSEVNMQFRNISTNSLSPYAAKFAGRQIKSGSLSLTLDYKLANNKLNGSNNIILESLVLGEKVSSPDAMDLPLDMAISLLQDGDGKIDIKIPIKGDLDNPEFEIKSIVQKAIGNLIGGIVTAPFTFIGSLFDIDGEELKLINFEPGQSEIMPPEAEKLTALGKALLERPALILVISGVYDAKRDSLALGRTAVLDEISKATENEEFTLNYSEPEVRDVIDELVEKRLDKEIISKLKEKEAVNSQAEESSALTAYYKNQFSQLVIMASSTIDKSLLELLARDRVNTITDYIKKIDVSLADRIKFEGEFNVVTSETEFVSVTLDIDIVK